MARRTKSRNAFRGNQLQGVETLESRRLLSVNSPDRDQVEEKDFPLDETDWTVPDFPSRLGSYDPAEIFNLQSKPDSDFTIYIDVDGHVTTNTIWNSNYGIDPIVSPPFDLDGDPSSFSQIELERILISWQETAEDFAPFDVNVTTRDPGLDALVDSGGGDTTWGARAVVTSDTFANCGCGGHAFLNTFDDDADTPTFVYNLGPGVLGETVSHEVGHMLGLTHDGNSGAEYYPGHGSGDTSWGTIMGAAFNENVTQWNDGDYFDAGNNEDDLSVITGSNGFGYRADDFGDSTASANPISVSGGNSVHAYGIIETGSDRDYFEFETGAGNISFDIDPLGVKPNLDIFAALYDASGNVVQFSNTSSQLEANISANVAAGTYYLRVEGVGSDAVYNAGNDTVNDPTIKPWESSNPTGYSDYGSLGQYTVNGSIVPVGGNTFSIAATDAVKLEGQTGQQAFAFTVTRTGDLNTIASVAFDVTDTLPTVVGQSNPDLATMSDFAAGTAFSGMLLFNAGVETETLIFQVQGDSDFELDEYFDVTLSDATPGWTIAGSQATGTILSDESQIGVSSLSTEDNVNEGPYDGALVRWRQLAAAGPGFDEWAIDNISLTNSTLTDNFDPIDNSNWTMISGGSVSNQFGGSGNALTFNDISDRRLVTNFLDASPGDVLSFDIIFGDGSNGGENVDAGEDVLLEYSLDGGSNWQQFDVFDTEDYTSWTSVQATLPTAIDTNPPSELTFEVQRIGGNTESATADWAVDFVGSSNPADASDFLGGVLPSGQVTFAAGESTSTITIQVNGDADIEADETFRVLLTGAGGAGSVTLDSSALVATGTINNDDAAYNVNQGSNAEYRLRQLDNSGSGWDNWGIDNFTITGGQLNDDFDPNIDLSQWNNVSLGTANTNFGGSGNSLSFDGDGERSISTDPITAASGDALSFDFIYGDDFNGGENPENGDEVVLEYSIDGGSNWVNLRTFPLNVVTWTTINQPIPANAIQPDVNLDEGSMFSFTVERIGVNVAESQSIVDWEIVGSGANPADANDFPGGVLPAGTLTFAPGESSRTITIATNDDAFFESDETFDFVVNAAGGIPIATATIINNDTATMIDGDFDNDGDYDCDDIDMLVDNIANQTNVAQFDLNGDAALTLEDRDEWLAAAGAINLTSGNAYIVGDANLDGAVNGADFIVWNSNKFSSNTGWCGGDFNADGFTNGADFILWNANKFTTADASSLIGSPATSPDSSILAQMESRREVPLATRPLTAGIVYHRPAHGASSVRRIDLAIHDWSPSETTMSEDQLDELALETASAPDFHGFAMTR